MNETMLSPTQNGIATASGIRLITPAEARRMLSAKSETGIVNRPIHKNTLRRYIGEMQRGQWVLQYEPIILSRSGFVLDGQHRLSAVVECDTPQWFLVVSGVDESLMAKIGTGDRRSPGDALAMAGHINTNTLASILRLIYTYKKTRSCRRLPSDSIELHEMIDLAEKYPNADEAASYAVAHKKYQIAQQSIVGAMWYLLGEISTDNRNEFFARLMTGTNLSEDSPIYVLRERLIGIAKARDGKSLSSYESQEAICAFFIKGWNAYREGNTIRILRYKKGESFPVPV